MALRWAKTDVAKRVTKVLADTLAVSESDIGEELLLSPAADDGNTPHLSADSLDVVEIIMSVEEAFGIAISDDDAERLCGGTVAELIDHVHALQIGGAE